ncbi:MAG: hypothetical protein GX952_03350 [Firmicutes bacterium]|nr:hypothetical protein [Bacillota bacterium]
MGADALLKGEKKQLKTGFGWGLAAGVVIALLLTLVPPERAIKYTGAALAAYFVWQRPKWGLYFSLVGLAFLPTMASGCLILFTLVVAVIRRWAEEGEFNLASGVDLPLWSFFILAGLASCTAVVGTESLKVLPFYILYLAAFYLAAVIPQPRDIPWLLGGLVLAGLLAGAVGLLQYKSGIQTSLSWIDLQQAEDIKTRVFGPFDNPNIFAEYLTFILPVALVFFLTDRRLLAKTVWALAAASAGAALVTTFSRGGWLAALTGMLALGFLWEPWLLLVMAMAVLLLPTVAPRQVLTRAASIGSLEDSSNVFRLSIWAAVLKMIAAYWLTGIGPGPASFNRIYPLFMIAGTPAIHSHNLFLQLALELGLPGLAAFVWILAAVFSRSLLLLPQMDYPQRGVLAALLSSLIGFLLHGLVDNVWYSPKIALLFWLMLGLTVALGKGADGSAGTARNQ